MYKAIAIQQESNERLLKLAKGFFMDIITHRINEGIMDEDTDGSYQIEPDGELNVDVWVTDTCTLDSYLDRMEVKQICLENSLGSPLYVVVGEYDEEVYLKTLPVNSIVDICCNLEDIWDKEVGE